MKFSVGLVLFLFITFLSTPTIVSLIEKSCDTSVFYTMSEEELAHKEVKLAFTTIQTYEWNDFSYTVSRVIISENLSKHDKISATIFIPPPEQV